MKAMRRMFTRAAVLVVGALGIAAHLGCSRTPPSNGGTVRGRVTFQGQPVAGGSVVFAPDPNRGTAGKPLRAETAADGSFQLHPAGGGTLPPGWYRVALAVPPDDAIPGGRAFPAQLRRPDQSGLIREITGGRDHFFEFAVEVPNG